MVVKKEVVVKNECRQKDANNEGEGPCGGFALCIFSLRCGVAKNSLVSSPMCNVASAKNYPLHGFFVLPLQWRL